MQGVSRIFSTARACLLLCHQCQSSGRIDDPDSHAPGSIMGMTQYGWSQSQQNGDSMETRKPRFSNLLAAPDRSGSAWARGEASLPQRPSPRRRSAQLCATARALSSAHRPTDRPSVGNHGCLSENPCCHVALALCIGKNSAQPVPEIC